MSGKSKEEVAFELVSKLKGVGVWGENNMSQILDMYALCLEAASGLRELDGKVPSALRLQGMDSKVMPAKPTPPKAAPARQAVPAQQTPAQTQATQAAQLRQQQQRAQQAYQQQQQPVAR